MTKKDYEVIAEAFKFKIEQSDKLKAYHQTVHESELAGRYATASDRTIELAYLLAHKFMNDNPRFNKEKFLQACGIQD